jgi:two-component system, sensor histidine kinase and response regulator
MAMGMEEVAGLPRSGMQREAKAGVQGPDGPSGPLVLIVDDGPLNRTVMGAMLQKLRYRFDLATNGREAVEAVCRERYAAVLMDCLMPEMDGYQATAAIRKLEREGRCTGDQRHLPIIAVTAVAIKGARERCMAAGMDDYLSKPVTIPGIATLLERWTACDDATAPWSPPHESVSDQPEEDAIDRAALDAVRELDTEGGDVLVAQMIGDFRAEVSPRMPRVQAAAAEGDIRTLLGDLHFIAGCASIVGATRVERLARSLEAEGAFGGAGGQAGAVALAARLCEEVQRAERALASMAASAG